MVGNGRRVLGAEISHQSVACSKKTGTSVHKHKALNSTNTLSEIGRGPEPQMGPKPIDTLILPHETLSKELSYTVCAPTPRPMETEMIHLCCCKWLSL